MYGCHKDTRHIEPWWPTKEIYLIVLFFICCGPDDANIVHYAVLTSKHNYNLVPWFRILLLKGNTGVFLFLLIATSVKVVVVYPLPWPLSVWGVQSSRFWSTNLCHIIYGLYSPLDLFNIGLQINIKGKNEGETFVHTF